MNSPTTSAVFDRLQHITFLSFIASVLFYVAFELSKLPQIVAINPFAEDPYDAVGSVAIQIAALVAVLTLARSVHQAKSESPVLNKFRVILRGNAVVFTAIVVTLITDGAAILRQPDMLDGSIWSAALMAGFGMLSMFAMWIALALIRVYPVLRQLLSTAETIPVDESTVLGEAVDDIIALIALPVEWLLSRVPLLASSVRRILRKFMPEKLPLSKALNPRAHPWRFTCALALGLGILTDAAHFIEDGPAPDLARTLVVAFLFLSIEFTAVILAYLAIGRFLGLRPPLEIGNLRI